MIINSMPTYFGEATPLAGLGDAGFVCTLLGGGNIGGAT